MKNSSTIFHKIISGEIPAQIIFEDEQVVAFKDINPVAPSHVLIVPRKTIPSLKEVTGDHKMLLGHMLVVAGEIAKKLGLEEHGYRVVINSGEKAGQSVFQLHFHLMGGREFSWPPG